MHRPRRDTLILVVSRGQGSAQLVKMKFAIQTRPSISRRPAQVFGRAASTRAETSFAHTGHEASKATLHSEPFSTIRPVTGFGASETPVWRLP
jgi:hypothetical protein